MNSKEAQMLFKYRTRMANFGENFRGNKNLITCPLCHTHLDNQKMSYENCPVLQKNISIPGKYNQIFNTLVPSEVVQTLTKIDEFCENFMSQNEANSTRQHNSWMGASDNPII